MWPLVYVLPTCLLVVLLQLVATSNPHDNNIHSLVSICENFVQWEDVITSDAIIRVKDGDLTGATNMTCSLVLKAFQPNTFIVKVTDVSDWASPSPCIVHLKVIELQLNNSVLADGCLLPSTLTSVLPLFTAGSEIRLVFTLTGAADQEKAIQTYFSVVVAAIIPKCPSDHFDCGNYCIHPDLVCDGVPHCLGGEDEPDKLCTQLPTVPARRAPPPRGRSTGRPASTGATVSPGGLNTEENIYLWLPLLVVVVFTVVMLALILAGRRAGGCSDQDGHGYTRTAALLLQVLASPGADNGTTVHPPTDNTTQNPEITDENIDIITIVLVTVVFLIILIGCLVLGFREQRHRNQDQTLNNGLRIETHSNAAISDGAPATPPPTYSMIERQTSYVSQISQTSSQISVPPAYEEAVDEEEDPMSWRRRLRRHLSRSRSTTSRPSSRRQRLFQRSLSAQDTPGRYTPDTGGSRPRNPSDPSDTRGHPSVSSDTDSVFEDPSSQGNNTAPGVLENVSEVDESLHSSTLMLSNNPSVSNGAEHPNDSTTPATTHLNSSRPVLQRSISDITGENSNVIFSLGE